MSASSKPAAGSERPRPPDPGLPATIDGRYRVLAELGRGGMARVYRVLDETSGRRLALKQLQKAGQKQYGKAAELFEREYRTLAQLSHPNVIEAYDYGIVEQGPYYTMELLDGGDLRERAPLGWRTACELTIDICSSLALLHSRRLVHRDISPRNIRCTEDGRAKLIDFGAMAPIGPCAQVVGTPGFIAPEVVHRSALDARTDLYSLGATLYYALARRMPYPARDVASVLEAWGSPLTPPSAYVADIPAELDALVTSMISLEPALRPRSAFEVMQRLIALTGLSRQEPTSVARAYLSTPVLVGRAQSLTVFRGEMERALQGRGGALLIKAESGLGRSRLLDAFALEAKLLGAATLRAGARSEQPAPLATARLLCEQLIEVLPDPALCAARETAAIGSLFDAPEEPVAPAEAVRAQPARLVLRDTPADPAALIAMHDALVKWFAQVAGSHALLLAVDDVDRIDAASVALLAELAPRAARRRLLLCVSREEGGAPAGGAAAPAAGALEVLAERCTVLALPPLDRAQTEALLVSLFGDVPNIALLSERVHASAAGRPRECMALAQQLVDRNVIVYDGGSWTLPADLSAEDLPAHQSGVYEARVAALSPRALRLACLQSLSEFEAFELSDYAALDAHASIEQIEAALFELVACDVLQCDGLHYTLAHRAVRGALQSGVAERDRALHHRVLAELYERTGRSPIAAARHWLEAGEPARALACVEQAIAVDDDRAPEVVEGSRLSSPEVAAVFERALEIAEALPRPPRALYELRRWMCGLSIPCEDRLYDRAAPLLLPQLERDSGLVFYREQDEPDPMQRLMRALQRAGEQYAQTPEAERVYRVDEAIKHLVTFVVTSIAIGARRMDTRLFVTLPRLVEPFAPLSPVLDAIWQNTLAVLELHERKIERARARWQQVYERLAGADAGQLAHAEAVRNAVAFALGTLDALVGIEAGERWAAVLERDPYQRVNAIYLRKVLSLQRGDFDGAERYRREAELAAARATTRQMFPNPAVTELYVHAAARDLTGVRQLVDRIAPLAAEHEAWRPYGDLARAHFHRLSGDLEAARASYLRAIELSTPDPSDPDKPVLAWPSATAGYIETLIELGEYEAARSHGERELARCTAREMSAGGGEIERVLALAEAKAGDLTRAAQRLDAIIAQQRELGVAGLQLGTSYEARTRVAIWAGDHAAVAHYGPLCAGEYRYGRASPLGANYERLLHEARRAGVHALPQLALLEPQALPATAFGGTLPAHTLVTRAFDGADGRAGRAAAALGLLCDVHSADGGYLYVEGESGLGLAATHAVDRPEQLIETWVSDFWRRTVLDPDLPTALVSEDDEPTTSLANAITDVRGRVYRPVPIACTVDGTAKHVGVALLIAGDAWQRKPNAAEVVVSVASQMLRSGDACAASL